jgi:uncharacterized membrane protein YhaH (DUF805 family)
MDFPTAVKKGLENVGNVEGRAGRAEFWWFVLGIWVIEVVVLMLTQGLFGGGFLGNLIWFIVWVVAWVAMVTVGVRRLHDVGQSGWLLLLWLIPCIGLVLIYFWIQPSQGDNQYGPAPTD